MQGIRQRLNKPNQVFSAFILGAEFIKNKIKTAYKYCSSLIQHEYITVKLWLDETLLYLGLNTMWLENAVWQ